MPRCTSKKQAKLTKPTMSNISDTEKLVIARRRAGMTQEDLRKKIGLTRRQYQRIESGKVPAVQWDSVVRGHKHLGPLIRSVEHLDAHERCHLARLRAGMTLIEVGRKIGYAKFWVGEMEHGRARPDPLVDFWSKRFAA